MIQGVYSLVINNKKEQKIKVGKLGKISFSKGIYVYIGSALGKTATNLNYRLKRHLSSNKKLFWHIDYFLNSKNIAVLTIIYAYTQEQKECSLAIAISEVENAPTPIIKFGSSDCNCISHLYHFTMEKKKLIDLIKSSFFRINLTPIVKDLNNFHGELNF